MICFKSGKTTALTGSRDIYDAKAVSDTLWMKQLCHLHSLGIVFGCHWRRLSKTTELPWRWKIIKDLESKEGEKKSCKIAETNSNLQAAVFCSTNFRRASYALVEEWQVIHAHQSHSSFYRAPCWSTCCWRPGVREREAWRSSTIVGPH